MSIQQSEAGFTLIELLVAMTLSLVVLGATLDAFAGFARNSRAVNVKNDSQQDVRLATDQLARELRNAVSSGTPTQVPLERATAYDLIFQTVDRGAMPAGSANTSNLKRVRYCLDDSTPSREQLVKQTQTWTSASPPGPPTSTDPAVTAPCPSSAWGGSEIVADRLVNRNAGQNRSVFVFSYTPSDSTNLTDVTGIQTYLFVNREPAKTRSTAELTSAVRLRNTNRAPTAAFTVTQQNQHVVVNSNSQDPEGEGLTYQWSLDGTPTPNATSSRYDYVGLASGSSHTITLKVTDPAGLSDQATQSVKVK